MLAPVVVSCFAGGSECQIEFLPPRIDPGASPKGRFLHPQESEATSAQAPLSMEDVSLQRTGPAPVPRYCATNRESRARQIKRCTDAKHLEDHHRCSLVLNPQSGELEINTQWITCVVGNQGDHPLKTQKKTAGYWAYLGSTAIGK